MNTAPFLLGATLLFWGWQTDLLAVAAVMAVFLEGSRLWRARWEFSQTDLDRIWNFCTLLFLGAAVYAFTAGDGAEAISPSIAAHKVHAPTLVRSVRAVFLFFQWMPLYFIPIMAVQAWMPHEGMDLSTFSWWLRRKRVEPVSVERESDEGSVRDAARPVRFNAPTTLNISYAYFAICLLAASAARARSPWFLGGLVILLGWAFWERRSRAFSPVSWAASLFAAAGLGLAAGQGLFYLEAALQRLDNALVARFGQGRAFDVTETRTMLGTIGTLKLSGRIVMRVKSGEQAPPALLREGTYTLFQSPFWASSKHDFTPLFPEEDERTWLLVTNQNTKHSVTIASLLHGGKGPLALPQDVAKLEKLPVFLLERNRLGAVHSEAGPGFVEFEAAYGPGAAIDDQPGPEDLLVPASEKPALAQITAELKLRDQSAAEAVRTLTAFFNRQFEYSTWLGEEASAGAHRTPISQFLLQRRKGHCEYFATATTLLLREAGIPARYAVGYAVQERKGGEYIVRARHAHAWSLAWVEGAWREVDTTPGSWEAIETGRASFWEPLSDGWSRLWFTFSKWRWGQSQWRTYLAWLIALPLLGVAVRLFSTKGWRRTGKRASAAATPDVRTGLDSEFYLIESHLARRGLVRHPGETALAWLHRLESNRALRTTGLEALLALHYRLRFDPVGLDPSDRAALSRSARVWLKEEAAEQGRVPRH